MNLNRILNGIALLAAVLWLTAGCRQKSSDAASGQIWTCSMHPQVRLPKPGKCPICEMPLIPAKSNDRTTAPPTSNQSITISDHGIGMAGIVTAAVERRKLVSEIRATGKIQPNETALATVVSRVDGYIEKLYVNYTGTEIKKGDHLVEIYSPDLVVAQQELLLSAAATSSIVESTRLKLFRWGLTEAQIEDLARNKKTTERITLYSPISGTVLEKMVVQNSAVKAGDMLYRVANLESVWVYLDIFERELGSIKYGQQATLTAESFPGQKFVGRVWFISPVLNDETRTVRVLINANNEKKVLRPGMYVSAEISVPLLANGHPAPTGVEGMWTCPMHPAILQRDAGKCPACAMALTQIPGAPLQPSDQEQLTLAVPFSAVLDSGMRKLVYIEKEKGEFQPREVTVGPRAGEYVPVLGGLSEGERVAIRGNFLLDSQLQIQGMASLFFPDGQSAGGSLHQHGSAPPSPKAAPGKEEHQH